MIVIRAGGVAGTALHNNGGLLGNGPLVCDCDMRREMKQVGQSLGTSRGEAVS
jgi:hypothetical protein